MVYRLPRLITRSLRTLLRLVLLLLGTLTMLGLAALGLVLGLVVVLWARLRGRRSPMPVFGWANRRPGAQAGRWDGEVIDVQAQELPDPVASLPHRPNR